MGRISTTVIGIVLMAVPSFGQDSGSIHATVLDDSGTPVKGATVYAMPLDWAMNGIIPHCVSDESGSCTRSNLGNGRYSISVAKPEDGYPEMYQSFYAGLHVKETVVTLSPEHPSENVVVHLAKKAGILKGTVADAVTGKHLNANVEFRRVSEPANFLRGSGLTNAQFRILVPSDVAVTMVVSLEGYEDWTYTLGKGETRNAVLLRPGEELTLEIRLWPKQ